MKKFVLIAFLLASILTSCNVDDVNNHDFYLEVVPIDSVVMPEYFVKGEVYQIDITYTQPSSCYYFNDFFYEIDGQQRTVAVVNTVYTINNTTCIDAPEEVTVHFNFHATGSETYVFKFFQGEVETNGVTVDQYYIVEVPVVLSDD
ncbi:MULTISPECIES: hypothetical protein [Winogradskyella]|uniref:DUF3872 domain-containing protein n=1 Tax=Winogradskyella damuponensis TaxID=943939 RepID=A0ABP8D180_9FLAO